MFKNKMVIWLLYLLVWVYNGVDVWQTYLLFQVGAHEVNPILRHFMTHDTDILSIITLKIINLTILGILLLFYKQKRI